jgi:adenylate cyclase
LFADVAGYTTLSERYNPEQLRELMHQYFEATFTPIRQNGGLVVGLAGDSFLAVWKSAVQDREVRHRACSAALDIADAVSRFNQSLPETRLPIRIAIHCGEMFLGNIGAGVHYEYGVTGDTVNTAARMDGLNKFLGTQILVSEEVIQGVEGFLTREAGTFLLKGKTHPVVAHQLKCVVKECSEAQQRAFAVFARGLRAFRTGSWLEAREKFQQCIDLLGDDPLSRHFISLCNSYENHAPAATWTGVIAMEEK